MNSSSFYNSSNVTYVTKKPETKNRLERNYSNQSSNVTYVTDKKYSQLGYTRSYEVVKKRQFRYPENLNYEVVKKRQFHYPEDLKSKSSNSTSKSKKPVSTVDLEFWMLDYSSPDSLASHMHDSLHDRNVCSV